MLNYQKSTLVSTALTYIITVSRYTPRTKVLRIIKTRVDNNHALTYLCM